MITIKSRVDLDAMTDGQLLMHYYDCRTVQQMEHDAGEFVMKPEELKYMMLLVFLMENRNITY